MKIIDLLNKIANGEEVPKKIMIYGNIYEYKDDVYVDDKGISLFETYNFRLLNYDVIILDDEEKKIPEKINNWTSAVGRVDDSNIEEYVHKLFEQQTQLYFKFNSIIDYLEKQRKGNEDEVN